nr:Uncharacterised protein [Streptococcus thermophilus]
MGVHFFTSTGDLDDAWFMVVFFALAIVWGALLYLLEIVSTRRRKRKYAKEWLATYGEASYRAAQEAERLVKQLSSPLTFPMVHNQWETIKNRFAAEPSSQEAARDVINAHRNIAYLSGIENGDERLRRQAVNELMSDAVVFGDEWVWRKLGAMRGKVNEPGFCEELARHVHDMGVSSREWNDANLASMDLSRSSLKKYAEAKPPTIAQREYRPGAGLSGYMPVSAIWTSYLRHLSLDRPIRNLGLESRAQARFYRRWLRGEVAR